MNPTDAQTSDGAQAGATSDGGTPPRPPRITPPKKPENEIFYDLASIHPLSDFDEVYFLDLLEHSLSLSVSEKKRVVDAIPTLSQFQVDELHKVFEDEREEFKKLLTKEGDVIRDLVVKAKEGWTQLRGMYLDEQREFEKQNMDAAKMNELKHLLDESDEA
jgi:succinate dehydrogenase flavin-adding protein (antitoxin of CptAB toxin-antitoxin module)